MYSVDDTVKALALAPARHIYSHAIFGSKSGTTWDNDRTYSDTDSLISAKIDIGSSSGGLTIGAAYSAKLTLKLMGDVTVNQTDRIIMRVGFYNSDGTKSDKIGLGWFYVDTITRKDKLTTVVAYDKMLRGAKIYKPTALTFPCRASAILDDICDKMGVSLRDGVTMPYDPIINEAPTKGKDSDGNTLYYTRREILGYLASIMGGNWFFDAGGHLAFTQFAAVSDTFAAANSTAADISSDAYAVTGITWNINGVPYSRFDDEDAAGMLEFSNPLKVDAKEPIMGAVEQRLVGLTYHSGTIQRQGCGWFELGDIVTAYRKDGTSAPVLITGINYSIEGGAFTEKIFSSALSDSESNYTSGDISGQTVPQSVAQEEAVNVSGAVISEYEYLSDTSVKFNGTTYTVEKDSTTGLIAKISDSNGNSFEPTINSGITDVALHNAVFWAVAMCRGLPNPPNIVELYNAGNEYAGITGGWFKSAEIMRDGYSTVSMTKQASYIELTSEMYYTTNAHDHNAFIAAGTVNKVDVTDYSKIVAEFDCEGTNEKGRAEFVIYVTGSYDVNQWLYTDIVMKYVYSPPANSDYSEIGLVLSTDKIASLTGAYYISFGFGGTNAERKGSCKLKRVYLER